MRNPAAAGVKKQEFWWLRWSLVAILASVAVGLLVTLGMSATDAYGQPTAAAGDKNNVFVVAGQISHETYGLYLVDYENKTIAVYKYVDRNRSLELRAVRTYQFDVQLDEYNTSKPLPREVKKLVRQQKRLGSEGK
jgi:hypothetical protein